MEQFNDFSFKNIKNKAGKYNSFNVNEVMNYLKTMPDNRLCSNITTQGFPTHFVNENEECKILICKYIDYMQKKNNIFINYSNKKSIFSNNKESINKQIKEIGYCFLDKIDENVINNILKQLTNIKYYGRNRSQQICNKFITIDKIPSHLKNKTTNIHTYFLSEKNHPDITDLLNIKEISSLIVDPTILKAAQNHLGCLPKLQTIASWITFYTDDKNELSHAAQSWHTDNDCHKFFKVFVYLNDVDETNGAHEIIKSSKKTISNILKTRQLNRGEIILPENKQILKGDKGTIILEDTRNLHRGGIITNPNKYRILLHWWYGTNNDTPFHTQYFDKNKLTHNILNDYIGIII